MVMMRRFFAWSLASQPSRVVAWPAALRLRFFAPASPKASTT